MAAPLPTLRKYQFFQEGYCLRSQGFTGTLELQDAGGSLSVVFTGGSPVRASSTEVALSFPAFLIMKRRVKRPEMREHLEEAARRGMKIDDLLLAIGALSPKDLLRLKRELSLYVFAMAFHKDRVGFRTLPGETGTEDLLHGREVLELHEGLFRAVAFDRDTDFLSRMFHGHWETSLVKTADFYRYLIQFRSVFYGEDISDLLLEPGASAQKVIDTAEDRESAIRQLFALTYSGMLIFEAGEDAAAHTDTGEVLFAGENAAATEAKTVVILPQEAQQAQVTSFLGVGEIPFAEEAVPEPPASPPKPKSDVEAFLETGFAARLPDEKPDFELDASPPSRTGAGSTRHRASDSAPAEEGPQAAQPAPQTSGPVPEREPEAAGPARTDVPQDQVAAPARGAIPSDPQVTAPAGPAVAPAPPPEKAESTAEQVVVPDRDEAAALESPPAETDSEDSTPRAGPGGMQSLAALVPEAAASKTMRMSAGDDDGVEDLLEKAVAEAEKFTEAARGTPRGPLAEPIPPQARPQASTSRLALSDPPPLPDRAPMPEPGTDESIERILEEVYRGMLSRNLYQVLNVTPFTPLSSVRESTSRLRTKYSIGQFSRYILSARAKLLLEYIGREVERAENVLTELAERTVYDNRVGTDYGQDRRVALAFLFDAEEAFLAGVVLAERGEWAEALQRFTRAAELNPRDPEYLARRGWAAYQALRTGQSTDSFAPNKARNILERALAVDPRHAHAMLYLARIEKEMDNLDVARTWYERLQKVDPGNEEAAIALEKLRSITRDGRKPESISMWERFKGIFRRK